MKFSFSGNHCYWFISIAKQSSGKNFLFSFQFIIHYFIFFPSFLDFLVCELGQNVMLHLKKQEQHQRGTANGIAMTAMSISKAVGPAGVGAL